MHDAKRLQKKVQNKIVSKWVLVWHLSNLETFTQRVQRYRIVIITSLKKWSKIRIWNISARAGWKFPNSTNVKLELISKRFYFELFFVNDLHHALNRHLNQLSKKVIVKRPFFLFFSKTAYKSVSFFRLLSKKKKKRFHRPTTLISF